MTPDNPTPAIVRVPAHKGGNRIPDGANVGRHPPTKGSGYLRSNTINRIKANRRNGKGA